MGVFMDEHSRNVIVAAIREKIVVSGGRGKLPCAVAFSIAEEFRVGRREIGNICNEEGISISVCQLGCFP